jgi:transcriptional regulator GlxA family with amidase domain
MEAFTAFPAPGFSCSMPNQLKCTAIALGYPDLNHFRSLLIYKVKDAIQSRKWAGTTFYGVNCARKILNCHMKQVAVLVPRNSIIGAIGNIHYMFKLVNGFIGHSGKYPLFNVKLIGTTREVELEEGLFTIKADALPGEVKQTDLIIIPPLDGDMRATIKANKELVGWISDQYKKGAEVACLCLGAFLLAETGLLNGEECSTHWKGVNEFRKKYPEVQLVDQRITTDHNGIYTSGGANSYWNLLVYLIQKYTSRAMAIRTSKFFEVEMDRRNQSQFLSFEGNKIHDDPRVKKAQDYIENHYRKKTTVEDLAGQADLAKRTFQRRFKKATHYTVMEYLQKVRMEAAKQHLESDQPTVAEAMRQSGYMDPKSFRNIFKKNTGMTPLEYQHRFQDEENPG